jgi:hypothetical protein
MAGVVRCGIKVNDEGKPDENGSPCVLKEGHELPHKPRTEIKVSDDDIKQMSATVAVVTAPEELSKVRRTRVVEESPLFKMAAAVTQGAYDAWIRGGKHMKWEDTPAIALDVKAELEGRLRAEIHRACAAAKRKATFGDTAVLTRPVMKDGKPVPVMKGGKPVIENGEPVIESEPTGVVKVFFQVRDLPAKKTDAAKPDGTKSDPMDAVNAVTPSPASKQQSAKAPAKQ